MLIILLLGIGLIIGAVVINIRSKGAKSADDDGLMILGCILVVFMSVGIIASRSGWVETIAELEAFNQANMSNYQVTADGIDDYLSIEFDDMENVVVAGSIEKFEQSKVASNALIDLRDKVSWYNTKLLEARSKRNSWTHGKIAVPEIPAYLTLVTIKSE